MITCVPTELHFGALAGYHTLLLTPSQPTRSKPFTGPLMLPKEVASSLSTQWPCRNVQMRQLASLLNVSLLCIPSIRQSPSEKVTDPQYLNSLTFLALQPWLSMVFLRPANRLSSGPSLLPSKCHTPLSEVRNVLRDGIS